MHNSKYKLLTAITLAMICLSLNAQPAATPAPGDVPSFTEDVWPIFVNKCNNDDCHGPKGTAFPKFKSHLMIKAKSKKIDKRLINERDPMPPLDATVTLTDDELESLRKWIAAGAPEN